MNIVALRTEESTQTSPTSTDEFTIEQARALGDQRSMSCTINAARTGFSTEGASDVILRHLIVHGPTPGEDLVLIAKKEGHVPHDDRAFGSIFGSLSRTGRIHCVGYCARRRGHGTAGGRIWGLVN